SRPRLMERPSGRSCLETEALSPKCSVLPVVSFACMSCPSCRTLAGLTSSPRWARSRLAPRRCALAPARLVEGAHRRRHLASLAQHVEPERTGERHRFREPDAHLIAEPVAEPGLLTGKCLMGFVVDIIVASQHRYRHEAVRAIGG